MSLNNLDIRFSIEQKRLHYWEIAKQLRIHPSTLSRWMRTELSPENREKVLKAISSIS